MNTLKKSFLGASLVFVFAAAIFMSTTSSTSAVDCTGTPTIPVYRLYKMLPSNDHFYTTSITEKNNAVNNLGYTFEQIGFYAFSTSNYPAGAVPVYRLVLPSTGNHFYTTSVIEKNNAVATGGYSYEGVEFFAFTSQVNNSLPVFRLYENGNGGFYDHFYTISPQERDFALANAGFISEGVGFYAFNSPTTITDPSCNNTPPELTISCNGQPNPANINQPVTFSPVPSGGIGSYSYSWSGACSGFGQTCGQTFSSAGSKTEFLHVTSGDQAKDTSCSVTINQPVAPPATLSATCNANPNPAPANQMVTFSTMPTGGSGGYVYSWGGACNANTQNCQTTFSSAAAGTQTATLHVTSQDGQQFDTSCSTTVLQSANPLTVSCEAFPNPANLNMPVTFQGSRFGGTGFYNYTWSGACSSGNTQNCSNSFGTSGVKSAHFHVTSGSQSGDADCSVTVNPPNPPALSATCSATPNPAFNNQTVTFAAVPTGGTGSYSYSWTGACLGSAQNCQNLFSSTTTGTQVASLRVTSGDGQHFDTTCSTVLQQPISNLAVTCSAMPNPANTNQQVTFSSTPTGGIGNYTYSWNNACTGSTNQTCTNSFSVSGYKNATVTVTSGSQTQTANCPVTIQQPVGWIPALTATCSASPNPANTNQQVTFTAAPSGGTGIYTYSWGGACSGSSQSCHNSYPTAGTQTATLHVMSGTQSFDTTCQTTVQQPSQQELLVSCSATPNPANINQQVTFASTRSGGTGSYTYSWSGDCTGSSQNCSNTFPSSGSKMATITVTSGSQTQSADCIVSINNTLAATCSAAPNPANVNQQVAFYSTITGGDGNYVYSWSGNCSGSNQNCSTTFNQSGNYSASLHVTSGGQSVTTSCPVTVNQLNNLNVSCSAAPNPANVNQQVTFYPTVSGGNGSYTYAWTGACSGSNQNCSNSFGNSGTQNETLNVTSGGQNQSATCSVNVNQTNNLSVSCYATPNPAQTNQQVAFNASASGGSGNYNYTWSGACSGYSPTCYNTFSQPNNSYTAIVTASSNGQTASTSCSVSTNQSCVSHSYQQCLGGSVHWFDSCNNDQGVSQYCNGYNQTCSGNTCINQIQNPIQNQTTLQITKSVRNLSSGNLNWSSSVNAAPADIVQFDVVVTAPTTYYQYGNQNNNSLNNVTVRDILPANLIYDNNLTLDGVANSGNIVSGLYLGNMSAGQARTITYQVQVAPAQNFSFGTTTLNNLVTASNNYANNYGGANSVTASASVVVTRSGVLGATTVSTGLLTGNFLTDSFFAPLVLALLGAGVWKAGLLNNLAFAGWIQNRKRLVSQKKLEARISKIKEKENQ